MRGPPVCPISGQVAQKARPYRWGQQNVFALVLFFVFPGGVSARPPRRGSPVRVRRNAAGVTLFSGPVKVPQGVVKFAAGDKTLLYFLDPDGVIVELAEYR